MIQANRKATGRAVPVPLAPVFFRAHEPGRHLVHVLPLLGGGVLHDGVVVYHAHVALFSEAVSCTMESSYITDPSPSSGSPSPM